MVINWDGIVEGFKVISGIILFFFAVYFAYKKIGYRVGCQLTISLSRARDTQISSIILQNHKDRPLAIIEIFGIQDNVKFEIEKPDALERLKLTDAMRRHFKLLFSPAARSIAARNPLGTNY